MTHRISLLLDRLRILGLGPRHFCRYQSLLNQPLQALVQGLHSHGITGLDRRVHLGSFILTDQVPDGR